MLRCRQCLQWLSVLCQFPSPCPRLYMLIVPVLFPPTTRSLLACIHHTANSHQSCACCAIVHGICDAIHTRSCSSIPDCLRGRIPRIDHCVDRPRLCERLSTPATAAVWLAVASGALCAVLAFYKSLPAISCAASFWAASTVARRVLLHPLL